MRAMLQRSQHPDLGGHGRIAGDQPGFQLVGIMTGLEPVTQNQAAAESHQLDLVSRVPALVVALDDRDLYRQEPALARLAVEKAHGRLFFPGSLTKRMPAGL